VASSALALLLLVSACACALPARAECPNDTITKPGFTYESSEPVYQTADATDFGRTVSDGWNLVNGTLRIHHWGGLGTSIVEVTDLFDVTGVDPGTEVVVLLRMDVAAWAATDGCGGTGCAGYVGGSIATPEQTVYQYGVGPTYGGLVDFSFWVITSVTLTAGTPLPVSFKLDAMRVPGGSHSADGVGTYRFSGLPAGAHVVSCQGYVDPTTPALPSSWGALKAAYR